MIIALKNTIDAVMNHNQMGKITISEFNAAASEVLRNLQASLFPGFRKLNYRNMRLQATTNYGNEAFFLQQAMEHYVTEKEVQTNNGKLNISEQIEDFFLVKDVFTDKAKAEKLILPEFNTIARVKRFNPSSCSPVYTLNNGVLKISPETQDKKLEVVYFRLVKEPKLTYRIISGQEVYDPDAEDFQDFDTHPIMHHAIFIEMLLYFGLNLKEEYAIQLAQQMKQEEQTKQQ